MLYLIVAIVCFGSGVFAGICYMFVLSINDDKESY